MADAERVASNSEYGGLTAARALKAEGVSAMFGVLGAFDLVCEEGEALGIKHYVMRHEQSGGFAADGYARACRSPGVTYTSNGPGVANVVPAIHHARGAGSPVVLLAASQPPIEDQMFAGQEGYPAQLLNNLCKWTHRVIEPATLKYWIRKALRDSMLPSPGPITLEFPANVLQMKHTQEQLKYVENSARVPFAPPTGGDPESVRKAGELLANAQRPVIIAGDGVYWSGASMELVELAELLRIPTCTRRTARGALPESHALSFSSSMRRGFLEHADVICLVGQTVTALDEWYEPPDWNHDAKWIQVQEVSEQIYYGLPTDVALVGSSRLVLRQMIEDATARLTELAPDHGQWLDRLSSAREALAVRQRAALTALCGRQPIHPHVLCAEIADFLDPTSTLMYDSFTASMYITGQIKASYAGQILDAGLFQTLGHTIGMAIGAQVARPGRQVLTIIGDGGFGIAGMDMETMARYALPAVVVLYNNSSLGGRAWGHDDYYARRNSGGLSKDVRYDEMFRAVGCHTEYVTQADQIRPALARAFESGKPSLLNVIGETDSVHPFRMRVNLIDVWTRGDFDRLTSEAQAEMRALPRSVFERASKRSRDNLFGHAIPAEELMRMVGKEPDA